MFLPPEVRKALDRLNKSGPFTPSKISFSDRFLHVVETAQNVCPGELATLLKDADDQIAAVFLEERMKLRPVDDSSRKLLWGVLKSLEKSVGQTQLLASKLPKRTPSQQDVHMGGASARKTSPPLPTVAPWSPLKRSRSDDSDDAGTPKWKGFNLQLSSPPKQPVFGINPAQEGIPSRSALPISASKPTPAAMEAAAKRSTYLVPHTAYQTRMDKLDIPYHWQWYIACYVKEGFLSWDDILMDDWERLDVVPLLKAVETSPVKRSSPGELLPKLGLSDWVAMVGRRRASDFELLSLPSRWCDLEKDLRREEISLRNDDDSRLGCVDPDRWYGGKVGFSISVFGPASRRPVRTNSDDASTSANPFINKQVTEPIQFQLNVPEPLARSNRFARKWGSRRFITCNIDERMDKSLIYEFFVGRLFHLLGRTFRAVFARDPKRMLLVETDEGQDSDQGPKMPSLLDFVNCEQLRKKALTSGHNPLQDNADQPVSKWAARFSLGLSDTIPAGFVDPEFCEVKRDTIASSWKTAAASGAKPPAEVVLTDGHGTMSAETAQDVYIRAGLFEDNRARPACVQMRYGGCKGMLSMNPPCAVIRPNIRLSFRDSQVKILWPASASTDRSLHMLELVRPPKIKSPSSLSPEVMILMSHGGIGDRVFQDILRATLDKVRKDFSFTARCEPDNGLFERSEDVNMRLLLSCYRYGGVAADKAKRIMKARGISTRGRGITLERADQDDDGVSSSGGDVATAAEIFGAEVAVEMLAAGFTAQGCKFLRRKIKATADAAVDTTARMFRLPIDRSLEGFIVTSSKLKPDEIMVSLSSALIDPDTHEAITHLSGTHANCPPTFARSVKHKTCHKLLTLKFKAVYYEDLAYLKDCVIMSANALKCDRSPASYLGGGDYDGDTVQVFWEPEVVAGFTNPADESCLIAPDGLEEEYFIKSVEHGRAFLDRISMLDETGGQAEYQKVLLSQLLVQPIVGIYTGLHNAAVYMKGACSPEAIRLAHVLGFCLDASKSGLTLRPERLSADRKLYEGKINWVEYRSGVSVEMSRQIPDGNLRTIRANPGGQIFMDRLMGMAIDYREAMRTNFDVDGPQEDYKCLLAPWDCALASADRHTDYYDELQDLRAEVATLFADWQRACSPIERTPSRRNASDESASVRYQLVQLRYLALAASRFKRLSADPEAFLKIKASCAVWIETGSHKFRPEDASLSFAFGVARKTLCQIKAGSEAVALVQHVWDRCKPNSQLIIG